jgi:alkanesulfonate monooxygenase SsuD/methylene tetrahydromethanopterin reductase-like flavin-dependent oxidoreductase (luciferase family)
MPIQMPAISLAAVPTRRHRIIEFAKEAETRGFAGIYMPSLGDNMALATALAVATDKIEFGTSICPIYFRAPLDLAQAAAFIHEVSNGRFKFGIGVAHAPSHARFGVTVGKPLADTRHFVETARNAKMIGDLPPIVLATLRKKMIELAAEIADGMVFANGSRSHMAESLSVVPEAKRQDPNFFIGDMIPTCIYENEATAAAVNRKTLVHYAQLTNYRNYWKEAGYEEEMAGVEKAMEAGGDPEAIGKCLSERWLSDNTLYGPPSKVLEGLEAWYDAGIKTPILVPSSAQGNQFKAIEEVFELCARLK